jgi:hypothetical protein
MLLDVGARLDAIRDWVDDDAELLAAIVADEAIQAIIADPSRTVGAVTDVNSALQAAVANVTAQIEVQKRENERAVAAAHAAEHRALKATARAEPGAVPDPRASRELKEKEHELATAHAEIATLAEVGETLRRQVEALGTDFRRLLKWSLPIWILGFVGVVSLGLLLQGRLSVLQMCVAILLPSLFISATGVRMGPVAWRGSAVERASAWITSAILIVVTNVVAALLLLLFS